LVEAVGRAIRHELGEEPVVPGELVALVGHLLQLPTGRDLATRGGQPQRLGVALESGRDGAEPGCDRLPSLRRRCVHKIEYRPHVLWRRRDDVQVALILTRVVQLNSQAEALTHCGDGNPVGLVTFIGDGAELIQGGAVQFGSRRAPGRRQIRHQVVIAGQADARGHDRVKRRASFEIGVRDPVDPAVT
jgi:hypothetical protein